MGRVRAHAKRGTEPDRSDAGGIGDGQLAGEQVLAEPLAELAWGPPAVSIAVVAEGMALIVHSLHDCWRGAHPFADTEESRLCAVFAEQVEQDGCGRGIGAIVER